MKCGVLLGIVFLAAQLSSLAAEPASTNPPPKKRSIFDIFKPRPVTNSTPSTASGGEVISHSRSGSEAPPISTSQLSSAEINSGLKEAIGNGLARAIATLGRTNGFLTNLTVRIPVPEKLATVEKTLRKLGQDQLVDDFVATMNHAAEQAVPAATQVFVDSLKQLTIADAESLLLSKSPTAATDFFRRTTTNQLSARFLPIVQAATENSGVTAAYKDLLRKAPFAAALINQSNFDLDQYVTAKSLDGLFIEVGEEEKRIRENPQARLTTLLQKVFGAVARKSP